MGGGFGGPPGAEGGGGGGMPPLGPDMGGGGMPGGDMGGGMGGGPAPGGPGGGPGMTADAKPGLVVTSQAANPTAFDGKVLTEKTRNKIEKQKQQQQRQMEQSQKSTEETPGALRDQRGRIMMTSIERALFKEFIKAREENRIRHPIHPQCDVWYGKQLYSIDLAFPDILLGVEADGETFHKYPDQQQRDKQRDANLAKLGWTILRFTDEEIEAKMPQVIETVITNIEKKEKELQQRND
jgi:very-short-patch-repair endonuclease